MKKIIKLKFITFLLGCLLSVQSNAQQYTTKFLFSETAPENILRIMETNVNEVFTEFHRSFYDQNRSGLNLSLSNVENAETIGRINSLWATSRFRCIETSIITRVIKSSNGYHVRNIPVYFEQASEKNQDIVIQFASDGKISDIYIALPPHQYANIIGNSTEVVDMRCRLSILDFVENFFNAFKMKDLKFIEDIFGEDELIITGNVVQRQRQEDKELVSANSTQIEYNTQNRQQYIANLRRIFSTNSNINVKFEDMLVRQNEAKPNFYGITLRLSWVSSSYNDEGWMFLLLDYKDEEKPLIWIRTWQPLIDPVTGNKIHYNPEDIFGLRHFSLN